MGGAGRGGQRVLGVCGRGGGWGGKEVGAGMASVVVPSVGSTSAVPACAGSCPPCGPRRDSLWRRPSQPPRRGVVKERAPPCSALWSCDARGWAAPGLYSGSNDLTRHGLQGETRVTATSWWASGEAPLWQDGAQEPRGGHPGPPQQDMLQASPRPSSAGGAVRHR